jgi:outer membrane receptor protein involved in Fe transport
MKLIRLVCAAGVVLVSGGCAEGLTAPQQASSSRAAAPAPLAIGQPLFVVDGHILDDQAEVQKIDPARIKNVEVLKGAATGRYGAGCGSLVLVTTKSTGR